MPRVHLTDAAYEEAKQKSAAAEKSMKEWVSQLIRDAVKTTNVVPMRDKKASK